MKGKFPSFRLTPLFVACVVSISVILFYIFGILSVWEMKGLDYLYHLRGERETDSKIFVIAIDDRSLEFLGKWPWPRELHARIIKYCRYWIKNNIS